MKRGYWWGLAAVIVCVAVAVGFRTWRSPDFGDYVSDEQQDALEAGLALRDVTLEQQDDNGQLLWRVHADEVTYSPDQESANLVNLEGELYQDGELLYEVKADRGVIRDNGQVIFLRENIVANGIQNQMVLKGDTLEWRPEEAIMIVRDGLTGAHPQLRAQANEARVYDREQRMELNGEVIATTVVENPEVDPWLKLQGNLLEWRWETAEIGSDQPIRVERFENETITEMLAGQQGLVELSENQVTLTEDVIMQLIDIPLDIATDRAVWDVDEQKINVDRPVEIVNSQEKVTLTAQQGQLDLAEEVVYLTQDVLVVAEENNSRLTTNRLTWNLVDQTVLAEGAVDYRQGEPQVTVRGPRAKGRIEAQTVVVDGGRVVTEIVPDTD
ncbi:MAG: LPS export ABC transporter periplasmic protein LptC [Leptolyngbya sp. SIO1E4]|nr:LPS export ABC transporter periplasmic protein LptC [Leptolyngbya sp. SIO1E4]